ncbi:helix-turn-helix transcriptional regulator [Undibacterium sp. TJN25]|uniref:helix-turn-helix transcriptional regulator n=1 Tax=Undibacterium sp. TJN25 TaxID=3413056 RepID=UPI003BF1C446
MYLSSSVGKTDVSAACFKSYQKKLHAKDGSFDRAKKLATDNELAMTYSHHTEFSPAHRAAIYSRHCIQDRLSIVCKAGDSFFATNFYRFDNRLPFSDGEVEVIGSVSAPLIACIRKHISANLKQVALTGFGRSTLAPTLSEYCPRLTARELDVCAGLLLGRTYEGIALDLGVSLATVKTYRARAYEKLGIHFKSQLFAVAAQLVTGSNDMPSCQNDTGTYRNH